MSTANRYTPTNNTEPRPEEISAPNCPHCAKQLDDMGCHRWVMNMSDGGLAIVVAAFCPNPECRKVLSTQTMLVAPQQGRSEIVAPS